MTSWLDWLLGLSNLSVGDVQVRVVWDMPIPAWVWTIIVLIALAIGVWSYSQLSGSRVVRIALGLLRSVTLVLLVVLFAGPSLERIDERVEPDRVFVLLDRSRSMQLRDAVLADASVAGDGRTTRLVTRDQALAQLLGGAREHLRAMDQQAGRQVTLLGFGQAVAPVDSSLLNMADTPMTLPKADQQSTRLDDGLRSALAQAGDQPISGIVTISDGRLSRPISEQLLGQLRQAGAAVHTLTLGREQLAFDLAVDHVDAPARAFVNDRVPVDVAISVQGQPESVTGPILVELIDPLTQDIVDRAQVDSITTQKLTLVGRSARVGPVQWQVRARLADEQGAADPDQPPDPNEQAGAEQVTDNNTRSLAIEFVDRPLRVLYIDGYPRWEYRYLKNLLMRESSIRSSVLLLSGDAQFTQEGDVPIARAPQTRSELAPFDVVIIGDVPAGYLSAAQHRLLREHVSSSAAGLIWIGGERHTPTDYAGSLLADLLPMRDPAGVRPLTPDGAIWHMWPTRTSSQLSVLRLNLALDATDTDRPASADDWPDSLPGLYWAQSLGQLKPAVQTLATVAPRIDGSSPATRANASPVVARMRYGSGQVLYVATDETWRFRYGRGEIYFERLWVPLIRMLGRSRVQQQSTGIDLVVSGSRALVDQPVVVTAQVRDPAMIERLGDTIRARLRQVAHPEQGRTIVLKRIAQQGDGSDGAAAVRYEAIVVTQQPGQWQVAIDEAILPELTAARWQVLADDDEWRSPKADPAAMRRLAEQTGGTVLSAGNLSDLQSRLANRARHVPIQVTESLWDSPAALALLVLLLTAEWIGRRTAGLA